MFSVILAVLRSLGAALQPRRRLLLENLALGHQLMVLNRNARKPRFHQPDRLLWVFLCAMWARRENRLTRRPWSRQQLALWFPSPATFGSTKFGVSRAEGRRHAVLNRPNLPGWQAPPHHVGGKTIIAEQGSSHRSVFAIPPPRPTCLTLRPSWPHGCSPSCNRS
jgi:hypothetical protein